MIRENFNKLHFDITEEFESVKVEEKSDRTYGNHIQLIIENGPSLKLRIKKQSLESNQFDWQYLADPTDETSIIERSSNLNNFIDHVKDIFENKRFYSEYLEKINK